MITTRVLVTSITGRDSPASTGGCHGTRGRD